MEHVEPDFEDDHATDYAEAVRGNTEEFEEELARKGEDQHGDKGYDGGTTDDGTALTLVQTVRHGQKDRHGAQRIRQREERCKAEQCEGEQ